jgi:chromosome segregation ATPase
MPHSTKTLPNLPSMHTKPPLTRQNSNLVGNGLARAISSEFGPTRAYNNSTLHTPEDTSASTNGLSTSPNLGQGQWSSAVGRANLGKSGRVIERLMGENDMLKRDLNIERLRAEESKQAVKMAEGKMEALAAEYDGKLHDAAINKTLLKRRERQLADLKSQIDGEKERADKAVERERGWREAMERLEVESKRKVEEAQTFASLMEGRNKAMTSHWKEQGAEVNRTVGKLRKEIEALVQERRNDDSRMNMLQGLCDQQAEQFTSLQREKDGIQAAFENYKVAQDDALKGIKERARAQEDANEEALKETHRVLGELKWALGVKKNVKGAQ